MADNEGVPLDTNLLLPWEVDGLAGEGVQVVDDSADLFDEEVDPRGGLTEGMERIRDDKELGAELEKRPEDWVAEHRDDDGEAVPADAGDDDADDGADAVEAEPAPAELSHSETMKWLQERGLADTVVTGKNGSMKLSDMVNEGMRHADYHSKTREAAEIRKQSQSALDDAVQLVTAIESIHPELAEMTRAEVARLTGRKNQLTAAEAERSAAEWVQATYNGDEAAAAKALTQAAKELTGKYKFTAQEIMSAAGDPRMLSLMRDVGHYQQLLREQAEVKRKVTRPDSQRAVRPTAKSRNSRAQSGRRSLDEAIAAHAQGDTQAGIRAVELMLRGGN